MSTFNLDDIEYEKISFQYNGQEYTVKPVTCEMQLELERLEKEITAGKGIQPLIDQILLITDMPNEIALTIPVTKLNELNAWIAGEVVRAKKKDAKKSLK